MVVVDCDKADDDDDNDDDADDVEVVCVCVGVCMVHAMSVAAPLNASRSTITGVCLLVLHRLTWGGGGVVARALSEVT